MAKKKSGPGSVVIGTIKSSKSNVSLFPARPLRNPDITPPGEPVRLRTNFFRLSIAQNKPIYQYAINIESEDEKLDQKKVQRKLGNDIRCEILEKALEKWCKRNPKQAITYYYVYDASGSTLYTLFEISPDEKAEIVIELDRPDDIQKFRVKRTGGTTLNLQTLQKCCNIVEIQEQIRAINVISRARLREISTNVMSPTCVYPFIRENQYKISPTIILNRGFFLSARPIQAGLALNVANTAAPFYMNLNLTDFLKQGLFVRDLNKALDKTVLEDLKRELKTKQIEATHINYGDKNNPHYRRYRINDIGGSSLDKFMLVNKETNEPEEITVAAYFQKEYKVTLKYPKLPCVIDTRNRKIPLELCQLIERQKVTRKLDANETSETLKIAAMKPDKHFERIAESIKAIDAAKKPLTDFGLQLDTKPITTEGRELPAISLKGGSGRKLFTNDGQYSTNDSFVRPATIGSWSVTYLVDAKVKAGLRGPQALKEYTDDFSMLYQRAASEKGMRINPRAETFHFFSATLTKKDLKDHFEMLNAKKIVHGIFVLPDSIPDWIYRYLQYLEGTVKRNTNESVTRVSCIKYQNFIRKIIMDGPPRSPARGKMFIGNLLYKYNSKMGGVNYVLSEDGSSYLKDGYIFISVDVCHPAPGDKLIQSVAAAVGMWDITNGNRSVYTCQRVQKKMRENHSTIEEVGEVGEMIGEILSSYQAKKKNLPSHIVIVRDGVSEGQFRIVLESELVKVKAVISRKYQQCPKQPLLSCFVVQKRHRTRYIRLNSIQNRKGFPEFNPQAGTVVDKDIVHPTDHDFYITSHKAIQGTSQPLHVYKIYDEINLNEDDAQGVMFKLSHLSPLCNKGTSVPTTVNLADRAAERGKNIVISWNDDNQHLKLSEEERLAKLNKVLAELGDPNYKSTLYYV